MILRGFDPVTPGVYPPLQRIYPPGVEDLGSGFGWFGAGFGRFWAGLGWFSTGFGPILAGFGPESEISVPRGGHTLALTAVQTSSSCKAYRDVALLMAQLLLGP